MLYNDLDCIRVYQYQIQVFLTDLEMFIDPVMLRLTQSPRSNFGF